MDSLSKTYDLEYQKSVLSLAFQFRFCEFCNSEQIGSHTASCQRDVNSAPHQGHSDGFITAQIFRHNPSIVGGIMLSDKECIACQLSLEPSPCFQIIRLCEKDLGLQQQTPSVDQVAYCIEMSEELFRVQCQKCKSVFQRTDFPDHFC